MSKIKNMLDNISESSLESVPNKNRFEEIIQYMEEIQDDLTGLDNKKLNGKDMQSCLERLVKIMFDIEYLQNDINRAKNSR